MSDYGFQPGQSPSDRRALFDIRRRLAELEALESALLFGPRRNLADNGEFRVAQRGSGTVSIGTAALYATADRWYTNNNAVGVWDQAVVDVIIPGKGLRKALRMICTTAKPVLGAGDFIIINHGVEGYTIARALDSTTSLKAMTLTFDAYTNVPGTYVIEFFQWNSAGTLTRGISRSFVMPANVWTSVTIPVPADASADLDIASRVGLSFQLFLAAGSTYSGGATLDSTWDWPVASNTRAVGQVNVAAAVNNNFHMTEVQLEVGDPTPYEHLSYDDELARYKRYFQRWAQPPLRGVFSTGSTIARLGMPLPVAMRAVPVLRMSGNLPVANGVFVSTLATPGGGVFTNLSALPTSIEFDASTTSSPGFVGGQAALVYQSGTGTYLDLEADI